jgi:ribose/xylose/arabinose/galactoside ABC-type transport system permease subunit
VKIKSGLTAFLFQRWAVIFFVLEFAVFSVVGAGFFSLNGIEIVLWNGTTLFLLAVAETFVIVTGGIDLSVGYLMGFSTIVSAKVVAALNLAGLGAGPAILLGVLITLAISLVPGVMNGFLVGRLNVPPFLATFSVGSIVYGVAALMIGGVAAKDVPSLALDIGHSYLMYYVPGRGLSFFTRPEVARGTQVWEILPGMVVLTLVFIVIASFVLKRTKFGRHAYAIGGNIDAAVRAGINTRRHFLAVYMIAAFFAALSGIIYMMEYVTGKADAGVSFLLDSIVGVVIGGASLYGGTGSVWGSALGCLIISVLVMGFRMAGIQPFARYIAVGAILIITVLIDQFFPELIHKED